MVESALEGELMCENDLPSGASSPCVSSGSLRSDSSGPEGVKSSPPREEDQASGGQGPAPGDQDQAPKGQGQSCGEGNTERVSADPGDNLRSHSPGQQLEGLFPHARSRSRSHSRSPHGREGRSPHAQQRSRSPGFEQRRSRSPHRRSRQSRHARQRSRSPDSGPRRSPASYGRAGRSRSRSRSPDNRQRDHDSSSHPRNPPHMRVHELREERHLQRGGGPAVGLGSGDLGAEDALDRLRDAEREDIPLDTLWLGDLPSHVTAEDLIFVCEARLMRGCVLRARVVEDQPYGFVTLRDPLHAATLLAQAGPDGRAPLELWSRRLRVQRSTHGAQQTRNVLISPSSGRVQSGASQGESPAEREARLSASAMVRNAQAMAKQAMACLQQMQAQGVTMAPGPVPSGGRGALPASRAVGPSRPLLDYGSDL